MHTCALTTNGNVKCWGNGQLGGGVGRTSYMSTTPVDILTSSVDPTSLSGITAISSGGSHTCTLTTDGFVKCWGSSYGEFPTIIYTSIGGLFPLSNIVSISSGWNHTCVLTASGNVKCWGAGNNGELGDGGSE